MHRSTLIYTTNHSYDQATQVNAVRIYYDAPDPRDPAAPPRAVQVVHLAQRQYFPAELEALLHYNGFALEGRAGDFDGGAFTSDSSEQVIRGYILSSPRITRGRNRKPLVEAGIDVERYRADWDAD